MTSRSLFFKLVKEDLKRRIWAVCLAFLCFFFWIPVVAAMGLSNLEGQAAIWAEDPSLLEKGMTLESTRLAWLTDLATETVGMQNFMIPFLVAGAAVVLGLTGFSWLHSRKKVDFYHSIPVRREVLFAVKYLDGILIVFSMYFLNLLFGCGILAMGGLGTGATLGAAVSAMLVHMVNYILIYTVVLAAVLMTGNFFISILGTIVFFSYVPMLASLLQGLSALFFETEASSGELWGTMIRHGSPIAYYIKTVSEGCRLELGQYGDMLPGLVFPLLAAAALMFFCLILYRLRPSEASGKAMAFRLSQAPIKVLLVVPFTIFMGILFWEIYDSMAWAAFGFLFGLAVTHCTIEILYHFDFRKLFSHLPQMAVCAVLALAVIGVFRYDLTGYDRYFPKESKFESASVYLPGFNDWNSYGLPKKKDGGTDWEYIYGPEFAEDNMRFTDYGTLKVLADFGIAHAAEVKELRMSGEDSWYDTESSGYWSSMYVTYRLKGGRTVMRSYRVSVTALWDAVETLFDSAEYKKGIYPVLSYQADNVTGIYLYKDGRIQDTEAGEELCSQILEAYKEEMAAFSLEERTEETPVGMVRFLTVAEDDYLKLLSSSRRTETAGGSYRDEMEYVNFFPIYPSFEKTIQLLKEAGCDVTASLDAERIDRIVLAVSKPVEGVYDTEETAVEYAADEAVYYDGLRTESFVIDGGTEEGTAQLQEIADSMCEAELVYANGLQPYDESVEIRVYTKDGNEDLAPEEQNYRKYLFRLGEIPEFVKELVDYDGEVQKYFYEGIKREAVQ